MATTFDSNEQEQQITNTSDRLPHHVTFNDDLRQRQQRESSINLEEFSTTSRQG